MVVSQAGNPILGAEQFFCSKWSCVGPLGVIQWEASLEDLRCRKSHFFFFSFGKTGLIWAPVPTPVVSPEELRALSHGCLGSKSECTQRQGVRAAGLGKLRAGD